MFSLLRLRFPLLGLVLLVLLSACGSRQVSPGAGIRGVSFVGITVSDLQRSIDFYSGGADLTNVSDYDGDSASALLNMSAEQTTGVRSALLRSSNAQLRLMEFQPKTSAAVAATPVQGPGIAHVCFQVNEKTHSYQRFLALGAQNLGASEMLQLNSRNPVSYAYVYDLEGAVMEVEHVDVAALDLPSPPANDYRIRHVSFATPDIDVLTDFYSRLLGGQEPREAGHWFGLSGDKLDKISGLMKAEIKMSWLQTRNLELEFVEYLSHPTVAPRASRPIEAPGYNMVVFDVLDLDQARSALLAAGGRVVMEPLAMDTGQVLFGRDPDGNLLGFQVVADDAVVSSQNFENNGL